MFDSLTSLLGMLNTLSPLGVIGLLAVVVLLMVHKKGPLKILTNNHMEHIQISLTKIAESSDKQVNLLQEVSKDINYMKGKMDQ